MNEAELNRLLGEVRYRTRHPEVVANRIVTEFERLKNPEWVGEIPEKKPNVIKEHDGVWNDDNHTYYTDSSEDARERGIAFLAIADELAKEEVEQTRIEAENEQLEADIGWLFEGQCMVYLNQVIEQLREHGWGPIDNETIQ